MALIIPRMPRERWHYPAMILLPFVVVGWYLINMKDAAAENNDVANQYYELPNVHKGELKLLTYNVAGLPELISSATLPRAKSMSTIGKRLNAFDLVNVQEDFNYNPNLYRYNHHPFRTVTKGKVPFGDGLSTLSRYPIIKTHRVSWNHCNGTDCLTPKGFAYMRVQLARDVFIDVYNLHATSSCATSNAVKARRENMKQLAAYINEHSKDMPLLIMGDFNAYYRYIGDNLHYFIKQTKALDPWVNLLSAGDIPKPRLDFDIPNNLEVTKDIESIDKILYRNSGNLTFTPRQYEIEDRLFSSEEGVPLSDHLAVSLRMEWEYTESHL